MKKLIVLAAVLVLTSCSTKENKALELITLPENSTIVSFVLVEELFSGDVCADRFELCDIKRVYSDKVGEHLAKAKEYTHKDFRMFVLHNDSAGVFINKVDSMNVLIDSIKPEVENTRLAACTYIVNSNDTIREVFFFDENVERVIGRYITNK